MSTHYLHHCNGICWQSRCCELLYFVYTPWCWLIFEHRQNCTKCHWIRSSSEEIYSILLPVLATVELWCGKKSMNRDEGSYTLSRKYDWFLATSHLYHGENRKKNWTNFFWRKISGRDQNVKGKCWSVINCFINDLTNWRICLWCHWIILDDTKFIGAIQKHYIISLLRDFTARNFLHGKSATLVIHVISSDD